MKLPVSISRWFSQVEFFKPIDLHSVYGEEFVKNKTFDSKTAEKMCTEMFYLYRTKGNEINRGDFTDNINFYDHKNAVVHHSLPSGQRGDFLKVKYSNVLSKMFIQIVFKELDLIIDDIKTYGKWDDNIHSRLIFIRYKTEMTYDDIWFINDEIIKGDHVKSFCGRNNMKFLWFVNYLCSHNVKRFANLILFHKPINNTQDYKIKQSEKFYTTYKKHGNYIVTPIDIKKINVFVDYIGYGGFKVYLSYLELNENQITKHPESMNEHIKELDEAIQLTLSLNAFKNDWGRNPWTPSHEYMNTSTWFEDYKNAA
jgi:hypothetical protein